MQNSDLLEQYREYLINIRNASDNTLSSYIRDLMQLAVFLEKERQASLE